MTATSHPAGTRRGPDRTARPSLAARRSGYAIAALVNAALLYGLNDWPGWDRLSFLTGETEQVLTVVNISILVGLVVNGLYLVHDPRWFRGFGDAVTAAASLVAMVRIWDVFPFDFSGRSFDWDLVVRVLLVVGIVGTAIGIVTGLVSFVRHLAAGE